MELDSPYGSIQSYLTLGGLAVIQGHHEEARPAFQQALELSQVSGFRSGEADSHGRLGQVALATGDEAEAAEHLRLALRLAVAIQEAPLIVDVLYTVAMLLSLRQSEQAAALMRWLRGQAELDAERRGELGKRRERRRKCTRKRRRLALGVLPVRASADCTRTRRLSRRACAAHRRASPRLHSCARQAAQASPHRHG